MQENKKKVVLIQEHLPHYRVKFYKCLKRLLNEHDIELYLYCSGADSLSEKGEWSAKNLLKGDLPWVKYVPARRLGSFLWQPLLRECMAADLVIVQQELKYLINFPIQLMSKLGVVRMAFWGHGKNFQASGRSLAERFKKRQLKYVDWWFAYNDLCKNLITERGFPVEKITSVNNSIDTKLLLEEIEKCDEQKINLLKKKMAIDSDCIAIYTGGLYKHKRIDALIKSAQIIKRSLPEFHLLVIGKGVQENWVKCAAEQNDWIHFLGAMGDEEKVPYWKMAKVSLMPGAVGLVVIDSFVFGVPMITSDYPLHGPEIGYLESGENGLIVKNHESHSNYAEAVIEFLTNSELERKLRNTCLHDVKYYSAEIMADNFASGVRKILALR